MEKKHKVDNYNIIEFTKSNIYIIENILDDNKCNEIKTIIECLNKKKISFFEGNNVQCYIVDDKILELDDELFYQFSTDKNEYNTLIQNVKLKNIYTNKLNGISKKKIEEINDGLNNIISIIKKILSSINPLINFEGVNKYIYRKIYSNTKLHIDGLNDTKSNKNIHFINKNIKNESILIRSVTFIFALNDDYDGGEFNFPYYDISVKLKKGSVLIFPPYWTHSHSTNELENKTYRYTVTTWGYESINT